MKDVLGEFCDTVDHVLVGCIIHKNVDGAHLLKSLVDELLAVLLLPNVGGEQIAFPSMLFDELLGLLGICLLLGQVCNDAISSLHSVHDRYGSANAGVSSRDDGLFALELAGSFVGLISAVFRGNFRIHRIRALHVALLARLGLVLDGDLMA